MHLYRLGTFNLSHLAEQAQPWPTDAPLEKFSAALADLGWTAPLVVDQHDVVIAGVRRYCALDYLYRRGAARPAGIHLAVDGAWLLSCTRLKGLTTVDVLTQAVLLDVHLAKYAETL